MDFKKMKKGISGELISVVPEGYNTVNPWIIARCADKLIEFLELVFAGKENRHARYYDADSLIIHAEVRIGNSTIGIFDSKPDWPLTPAFLQVYVDDLEEILRVGKAAGAQIVTEPSDFVFGERLARFRDPWGNLWWLNERMEVVDWEKEMNRLREPKNHTSENYIKETLLKAMQSIK